MILHTSTPKSKPKKLTGKNKKLNESWQKLLEKYDVKPAKKLDTKSIHKSPTIPEHRRTVFDGARSVDTGAGIAVKSPVNQYTGDAMLGIGQLHKSNAVPVFRKEDAIDQSKMRRG